MVDYEKIAKAIEYIGYGKRFIMADNSQGEKVLLVIAPLTPKGRVFIDFIYKQSLDQAIKDGLMTEAELLKDASFRGVWTDYHQGQIKLLEDELNKIPQADKNMSKREQQKLDKLRTSIEHQLKEFRDKRANLLSTSAERYAEEAKVRAFLYCCAENESEQKLWPSWQAFNEERDNKLIDSMMRSALNRGPSLSIKEIRAIARSGQWRHKWLAAKNIDKLWGKSVIDMTDEQTSLVYWSQVYDSVYEAYERPPQSIIDDDEALDKWLDGQSKKADDDAKKTFNEKKFTNKRQSSTARHGEIFYLANPDLAPVADPNLVLDNSVMTKEEIAGMNTDLGNKFLAAQDRRIKAAGGYIQEEDLRHDSDSRRVIGSKDAVVSIGRGRDGLPRKNVDKLLPGGTLKGRRV